MRSGQLRPAYASVVLTGFVARLVSELATIARPVAWDSVAAILWFREPDRPSLRLNWDKTVHKLRSRPRAAGLRPDLMRPDHCGSYELFLMPSDRVVDQT